MRLSLAITLLTTLIPALTTAHTKPDYDKEPEGNAITKPGLHDPVEAGKPYTVEWKADTPGPISIVLLRGPSKNVKPIDTLAEKIDNNGKFVWTPSKDLEPDPTHYGLMIVVEKSGKYQYSTQFGVKNPGYKKEDHKDDDEDEDKDKTVTITSVPTSSSSSDEIYGPPTTSWSSFPVTRTICPLCAQYAFATPFAFTTISAVPIVGYPTPMGSYGHSKSSNSGLSSAASRSSFIGAPDRNFAGLGIAAVAAAASVLAILIL